MEKILITLCLVIAAMAAAYAIYIDIALLDKENQAILAWQKLSDEERCALSTPNGYYVFAATSSNCLYYKVGDGNE